MMLVARQCARIGAKDTVASLMLDCWAELVATTRGGFWVSNSPVCTHTGPKSGGTLFFSLDFCVTSHVEHFTLSFTSFQSLVIVLSEPLSVL